MVLGGYTYGKKPDACLQTLGAWSSGCMVALCPLTLCVAS